MNKPLHPFQPGTRVRIVNHYEWPEGTTGTVTGFPGCTIQICSRPPHSPEDFGIDAAARRTVIDGRPYLSQWVKFDELTDDGSGDGPYDSAEIAIEYLEALVPAN